MRKMQQISFALLGFVDSWVLQRFIHAVASRDIWLAFEVLVLIVDVVL